MPSRQSLIDEVAGRLRQRGPGAILLGSEGRAFVYHGSASGLSLTANWTGESDRADAYLGYSVGTAGNVNGDGYADVIVGAPHLSNGQTNEGRAFV